MKQKIKKLAHQLWKDESGQGTLEYALIVVAVVAIVAVFGKHIKTAISGFIDGTMSGAMNNLAIPD